ncbi:MAG: homocitrate synthase/isopropylmalate synthase family protein, partial [Verrucomicrobiota bacterium]
SFTHESGIHCAGLASDPESYEVLPPEAVGRPRPAFVIGRHSGSRALLEVASSLGFALTPDQAKALLPELRAEAEAKGRALGDNEISRHLPRNPGPVV